MANNIINKNSDISKWFYIPSWKQLNLPLWPKHGDKKKRTWLVFKDSTGLSFNFVDHASASAANIILVDSSSGFEEKSEDRFGITMDKPEDYKTLFSILEERNQFPDIIVHFWNITIFHPEEKPLEKEHIPGFKSILFLSQALGKYAVNRKIELGIVTNHLFNITGYENYTPGKAMVLGMAKVIPQEFPNIHTRVIDVQLPHGLDDRLSNLALQLTAEFTDERKDLTIAYRNKQRWVQSYEPIDLKVSDMTSGYMKDGGTYIITGGLGRIGILLIKKLSEKIKANFILIDNCEFPEQDSWEDKIASKQDSDPNVQKIKQLQSVIENGSQINIFKADVGIKSAFNEILVKTIEKYRRIDGVIHAAGIVGSHAFKAIPELEENDWTEQFHAKVRGAKNIADTIYPYKPDFILLQSSMSAVLGGLGFGAYAAANAFLDAIAYQENQRGYSHWISVNWDVWDFGQTVKEQKAIGAEIAQLAVQPDEGIQAFERIFSYKGITQIVVSTGSLQERIEKWIELKTLQEPAKELISDTLRPMLDRPKLPYEYIEPKTDMQKSVANVWEKLLGIEGIGINDDFFDLGGNSLMGTQLISLLRDTFQVELPIRTLFEAPTIVGITKIIEANK